jgi:hypothetical protein
VERACVVGTAESEHIQRQPRPNPQSVKRVHRYATLCSRPAYPRLSSGPKTSRRHPSVVHETPARAAPGIRCPVAGADLLSSGRDRSELSRVVGMSVGGCPVEILVGWGA